MREPGDVIKGISKIISDSTAIITYLKVENADLKKMLDAYQQTNMKDLLAEYNKALDELVDLRAKNKSLREHNAQLNIKFSKESVNELEEHINAIFEAYADDNTDRLMLFAITENIKRYLKV